MNSPENNPPAVSPAAPPAPGPKKRTGKPSFMEDLIVTGFGFATSTAVAWGSWYSASHWDFAIYTWMYAFVLPIGAGICGFVAATGYWIGARVFNHKPSKTLLINIVLVSLTTYFAIHHFHYTHDKIQGVAIEKIVPSFPDYIKNVTENMTYKIGRSYNEDDQGTQLGKWGWGVAVLQVLGFSFGGFSVFGLLSAVPYCDRCKKYLSQKKSRIANWKDVSQMQAAYQEVALLMQQGHLQGAITTHATKGEKIRISVKAQLVLELRKCPDCEQRRLHLTAMQRNGNNWANVATLSILTEEPLRLE